MRGAAPDVRLAARQTLSAPIIAAFKPWLEAQLSRIPRSSKLAEDIRYTLARWPGLTRFLEDGRLELDTNPVENQIRKIALTRKNALFAGNEVGAEKRFHYDTHDQLRTHLMDFMVSRTVDGGPFCGTAKHKEERVI